MSKDGLRRFAMFLREYAAPHRAKDPGRIVAMMTRLGFSCEVYPDGRSVESPLEGLVLVYGFCSSRLQHALYSLGETGRIVVKADSAFFHVLLTSAPTTYPLFRRAWWDLKRATVFRERIRLLRKQLLDRRVVLIWVESNHFRDLLIRFEPALATKVVTLPQIHGETTAAPSHPETAPSGRFRKLLYVGRLSAVKQKRPDRLLLLAALNRVLAGGLHITAVGPAFPGFRMLARIVGLHYLGMLEHNAVLELQPTFDGVLLLSDYEGAPNVQTDALTAGVDFVTLPLPGIVELQSPTAKTLYPDRFSVISLFRQLKACGLRHSDNPLVLDNRLIQRALLGAYQEKVARCGNAVSPPQGTGRRSSPPMLKGVA